MLDKPTPGDLPRYFHRTVQIAGLGAIALIVVLSLVPGTERPHTGLPGKIEPMIAYAGTGTILALCTRRYRTLLACFLGLAALAGLMELMQSTVAGRSPSTLDAAASALGGLVGLSAGHQLKAWLAISLMRLEAQMAGSRTAT